MRMPAPTTSFCLFVSAHARNRVPANFLSVDNVSKQCSPVALDMIGGGASSNELGPIGGSFHGILFLTVEVQNSLIHSMCDAGDGSASDEIMAEVGVDPGSGDNGETQWIGCASRDLFADRTTWGGIPVARLGRKIGIVRASSTMS